MTVSPDERTLIFNRVSNGHAQIVRKSLPGGEERIIADNLEFEGGTFSPGGERAILAVSIVPGQNRFEVLTLADQRREVLGLKGLADAS